MKQYYKFTEVNDWEGETWHFYIPVDGNKREIAKLKKEVDGEFYIVNDELLPENEVDILCKHSDGGYMTTHNKLKGKLEIPNEKGRSIEDALYKGGICDNFGLKEDG